MISPACQSLMREIEAAASIEKLLDVAQRIQTVGGVLDREDLGRRFKSRYDAITGKHPHHHRRTAR